MTQEQDLRLIRRVQAGETEAFEDLVRAHEKNVYNLALRMTGDPQDAEDMADCALRAARAGDLAGTRAGLEKSGQAGAEGIRAYIDRGIPPKNAPITLTGGWMRNPVSKKPVKIKGKSGTTPLVDTGQLYNDFDWEIREK